MSGAGNGAAPDGSLERPLRRYPAAISAEAQALAWANREDAPHGATVVVTHEVSPRGRLGALWWVPAERTLACAVVLRPDLPAVEGDSLWLAGGMAAAHAAELLAGRPFATWWPDLVLEAGTDEPPLPLDPEQAGRGSGSGPEVAAVKASVTLGPGRVRFGVVTARFDLDRLGLDRRSGDDLMEAFCASIDRAGSADVDGAALAAVYEKQCRLLGRRVKLRLLPRGETRGTASGVDASARLVLASATGMVERVAVDALRELQVVPEGRGAPER